MINIIPSGYYYDFFSFITLFAVVVVAFCCYIKPSCVIADLNGRPKEVEIFVYFYFFIVLFIFGFRPISYEFGDMGNYNKHFLNYEYGRELKEGDIIFELLMYLSANFLNATIFFFLCFFLQFFPILWASKRVVGKFWPLMFLFIIANYDYYGYAVNGLRQGIAASVFLLALTLTGWRNVFFIILAIGFHKTYTAAALSVIIFMICKNPRYYLLSWLVCLFTTMVYSGFGSALSSLGVFSEEINIYKNLDDYSLEQFSHLGFRWDFVVYSAFPIFIGSYFILKKKITDVFYTRLFCVYLTLNSLWLLMVHMPSSNRIAYLSWGFSGAVIAYPFIKFYINKQQNKLFAGLIFCFYSFTFIMH